MERAGTKHCVGSTAPRPLPNNGVMKFDAGAARGIQIPAGYVFEEPLAWMPNGGRERKNKGFLR
jgi:hypothetical protein